MLVLYPNPAEVRALPEDKLRPFIFERLASEEADGAPELETVTGLGQLAEELGVTDLEALALAWLHEQPTAIRHDIVALLMMGFWPGRDPAAALVSALCAGLDVHHTDTRARDTLVLALQVAYRKSSDVVVKRRVWHAFEGLLPRREGMQKAALKALHDVLEDGL